jgi:uncharacterized protein YjiS (DUF1127 family)
MPHPALPILHIIAHASLRSLLLAGHLLAIWARRHRTRLVLRDLTRDELADVGLTEAQRAAECAKWFWEA